jgi:hypothetical protein
MKTAVIFFVYDTDNISYSAILRKMKNRWDISKYDLYVVSDVDHKIDGTNFIKLSRSYSDISRIKCENFYELSLLLKNENVIVTNVTHAPSNNSIFHSPSFFTVCGDLETGKVMGDCISYNKSRDKKICESFKRHLQMVYNNADYYESILRHSINSDILLQTFIENSCRLDNIFVAKTLYLRESDDVKLHDDKIFMRDAFGEVHMFDRKYELFIKNNKALGSTICS